MDYWVYILHCCDDSYYIGVTNNLELRFAQHEAGIHPESYTFNKRPLTLVYSVQFRNVLDAIAWEKQIKRWSRKKKEALIAKDPESLAKLAARQTPFHKKTHTVSA